MITGRGHICDLRGKRFGKLKVVTLNAARTSQGKARWDCVCACGNTCTVDASNLRRGAKSCGCEKGRKTHGKSKQRVYRIWAGMITRCFNAHHHDYFYYGARGIRVSRSWLNFKKFYTDMGDPPTSKHTIDRINNRGNYSKLNCRWATMQEQSRNKG